MKGKKNFWARCSGLAILIGCTLVAQASIDGPRKSKLLEVREERQRVAVRLSWDGMGAVLHPGIRIEIRSPIHLRDGLWTSESIISNAEVLASDQNDTHSATVVVAVTPEQAANLAKAQTEHGDLWPVLIPTND